MSSFRMGGALRASLVVIAVPICCALSSPPHARAQTVVSSSLPTVQLPPELDRVLRDYERGWRGRDAAALAELFTADGYVLRPGHPPARGRAAIREAYADSGGPLFLRPFEYAVDGSVGYILGGYSSQAGSPDGGKFVLAIHRDETGRWLIVADMDNGN